MTRLTAAQVFALARAAMHEGAWSARSLHVRAADLEALVAAGLVRQFQPPDPTPLYQITSLGRALMAATRGAP